MVGVSKTFPPQKQVLKNIYLSFFYGAKIGIIGLNGSGKSTLLKIIAGIEKDYQGEVVFSPGYSVGYLEQDPKLESGKTVKEIVQEGVQDIVDALKEFGVPPRIRWWIRFPVESGAGLPCAACCFNNRTYCYWMNRPTIWMPNRSIGWNNICNSMPER